MEECLLNIPRCKTVPTVKAIHDYSLQGITKIKVTKEIGDQFTLSTRGLYVAQQVPPEITAKMAFGYIGSLFGVDIYTDG